MGRTAVLVACAALLAGCAGGEARESVEVERPDCDAPSYPGPWASCPEADWVRAVAYHAGYRVVGDTGSAIELEGRGQNHYVWAVEATREPGEEGEYRDVAGVRITANDVRAWWDVSALRVWVSGGSTGRLPSMPKLEELVAASLFVPPPYPP